MGTLDAPLGVSFVPCISLGVLTLEVKASSGVCRVCLYWFFFSFSSQWARSSACYESTVHRFSIHAAHLGQVHTLIDQTSSFNTIFSHPGPNANFIWELISDTLHPAFYLCKSKWGSCKEWVRYLSPCLNFHEEMLPFCWISEVFVECSLLTFVLHFCQAAHWCSPLKNIYIFLWCVFFCINKPFSLRTTPQTI